MGLFDGLFKEKPCTVNNEKEITEISNLKKILIGKNLKIEKLEIELKNLKNTNLSPRQIHIMEKNLKSSRETNAILEHELLSLKEKICSNSILENKIYKNLINNNFVYKLPIDNFFKTIKFEEVRNFLINNNILFIQDMDNFLSIKNLLEIKNGDLAIRKYEKLKKGIVSWDLRIYLCKGEKIQKIYKSNRKFISYLNEHNIEFMNDMINFDFESLVVKGGFLKKSVKEFEKTATNYFNEFKL